MALYHGYIATPHGYYRMSLVITIDFDLWHAHVTESLSDRVPSSKYAPDYIDILQYSLIISNTDVFPLLSAISFVVSCCW